jgi:hypothetical protein
MRSWCSVAIEIHAFEWVLRGAPWSRIIIVCGSLDLDWLLYSGRPLQGENRRFSETCSYRESQYEDEEDSPPAGLGLTLRIRYWAAIGTWEIGQMPFCQARCSVGKEVFTCADMHVPWGRQTKLLRYRLTDQEWELIHTALVPLLEGSTSRSTTATVNRWRGR